MNRLVQLTLVTLLFSASALANDHQPSELLAMEEYAAECLAHSELSSSDPTTRQASYEACIAELIRLNNAEINSTDYAYSR